MNITERFWAWLAGKLAEYMSDYLQAGAHCGLCGKWVPYEIKPVWWAITICDECKEEYK